MRLYERTTERYLKYNEKRVIVTYANRKSKYHKTLNKTGVIKNCTSGSELGVLVDGLYNDASSK